MNNLVIKQVNANALTWTPLFTETTVLTGDIICESQSISVRVNNGPAVTITKGARLHVKSVDLSKVEVLGSGGVAIFAGGTWQ